MTSSIRSNIYRWMAAMFAVALVLGLLVGSNQNTARAIDPGQTDIAYVADGYNFPDALMGATLAGLNTAPMLGVRGPASGDVVPPETATELDRLTNDKSDLLDTIYVFGGPAAVSDKVVGELEAWATNVVRIAGADRFATMAEISQALPSKAKDSDLLDGMDSTDFLGATATAADSELLDGMDSTDFLGATDTAVDSDKLDGKNSTEFLSSDPGSVGPENLGTIPAARLTGANSIPSGSDTDLTFGAAQYDTANLFDAGTPTRLTAPIAGIYVARAGLRWQSNATGVRGLYLFVNNGDFVSLVEQDPTGDFGTGQNVAATLSLSAGDYVEGVVYQTSGSTLSTVSHYTFLELVWVAPNNGVGTFSAASAQSTGTTSNRGGRPTR